VTFGTLISGIDNLRRFSVGVVLELASAAVAGALFVWRQRLLAYPMLALELFARPVFTLSVVTSICSRSRRRILRLSRCRSSSRR
jgi:DHA2 family multidrug resistance protein-like MFS transporter